MQREAAPATSVTPHRLSAHSKWEFGDCGTFKAVFTETPSASVRAFSGETAGSNAAGERAEGGECDADGGGDGGAVGGSEGEVGSEGDADGGGDGGAVCDSEGEAVGGGDVHEDGGGGNDDSGTESGPPNWSRHCRCTGPSNGSASRLSMSRALRALARAESLLVTWTPLLCFMKLAVSASTSAALRRCANVLTSWRPCALPASRPNALTRKVASRVIAPCKS